MAKRIKNLALFVLFLVVTAGSWAATEEQLRAANAAFVRADNGEGKAADEATALFGALVKAEPDNPMLLVQLGAATTIQAREAFLPWKKMSYAEKGMAMQDKAVAMLTPKHDSDIDNGVAVSLRVRYVAARTFLAVPDIFDRKQHGEKLLGEVVHSPLFNTAAIEFRGHVWMRAASYAEKNKKLDDARAFLNLVVNSGAPQSPQAKQDLDRIGGNHAFK